MPQQPTRHPQQPYSFSNRPHRGCYSPHSSCTANTEDERTLTVPSKSHIVAVKSHTETATAHIHTFELHPKPRQNGVAVLQNRPRNSLIFRTERGDLTKPVCHCSHTFSPALQTQKHIFSNFCAIVSNTYFLNIYYSHN